MPLSKRTLLKKVIFGSKSEKYKAEPVAANQLNMFSDIEDQTINDQESITQVKGYTKKKKAHPGR